jgi:simple sugar transport system permease protein
VTALSILLAVITGGLLIGASNDQVRSDFSYFFASPGSLFSDAWSAISAAYVALFEGSIYNPHNNGSLTGALTPIATTIFTATPLICAGLGLMLAFRVGLFNIGGEGQVTIGAFAAGYVGFAWHLPIVVHLIVAILAGIVGGSLWALIAGFLKARTGAHEVITTIMLNYVAIFGVQYLLSHKSIEDPVAPQVSKAVDGNARLPKLFGSGLPVDLGIVLAVVAAALVWFLMTRTRLGFRLRVVGASHAAARTAGMNVSRSMMVAMALSGALTGLAGTTLILGGATSYQVTPALSSNVGFDAITVALLGRNRPWGTVAAGLLFGALHAGGRTMQAQTGVSIDIVTVIQALIVVFVAAPRLVRWIFRLYETQQKGVGVSTLNLSAVLISAQSARIPRRLFFGGAQATLGLLGLYVFALGERARHHVKFQLSLPGARFDLGAVSLPARPLATLLCLLAVLAGILRMGEWLAGRYCAAITVFGLLGAFLAWSVAGTQSGLNLVSLLQGAIFPAAIPLILGAMAGLIGERSGVLNIAIEAQLLLGAFVAAISASVIHTPWVGVVGGALAGMLIASVLAVLSIRYFVDQAILGVVLNVFALGLTNFLYQQLMVQHATEFNSPGHFDKWAVPLLSDIPFVGPVLFDGTIFLYGTYVLVAVVQFWLFHTRSGLRLRAVGDHPRAADTVGVNVRRTRYHAVLIGGLIAGVGGAFLVVGAGSSVTFSENISSGMGYIALATVIFGRWTPRGAVLAALLFGFVSQLQSLLSQAGVPIDPNLLLTAPYVATLIAVVAFVGHSRAPAADGQPYFAG